jgi:hypothetical protein
MLRREIGPARQALRALLAGRLIFSPTGAGAYRFEGAGSVTPLLSGLVPAEMVNGVSRETSRWSPPLSVNRGRERRSTPGVQ